MSALDVAQEALGAGLSTVPPKEDGSKAPMSFWKDYQERLPTVDELERWYANGRSGVGIVCGEISGNLELFEFDGFHAEEAEATYEAFKEAAQAEGLGEVVERIEAGYLERSPGGGRHWLWRCQEISGNTKLAERPTTPEELEQSAGKKIQALIETRGEGGYVVTAPSNGRVHETGEPYVLLRGGFATIAEISPEERRALFELADSFNQMPKVEPVQRPRSEPVEISGLTPIDDFNRRGPEILDQLLEDGWTLAGRIGDVERLWRPGKTKGSISATLRHCTDSETGEPKLAVFSSSTEFKTALKPDRKVYDRFEVWAVLHGYQYDLPAAVRDLYYQGYGDHRAHEKGQCKRNCPNVQCKICGWWVEDLAEHDRQRHPEPPEDGWVPPEVPMAGVFTTVENPEAEEEQKPAEQDTHEPPHPAEAELDPRLPEAFWTARPYLEHIRQAAWSRGRSPEAVLGAVLARVAADTPHDRKLPPIVGASAGLSLNVGLCGPPGTGKSSANRVATELIPARLIALGCDGVPPGSGEGLVELLFEQVEELLDNGKTRPVKRQTRQNAFVYIDEGEVLATQTRRSTGSTILPTLRSIFTDATIGQANASEERRRIVQRGRYVYGVVMAIQPEKAEMLFADAGAGTPQRFLWMATDTTVPPPDRRPSWPGVLARPEEPKANWQPDGTSHFMLAAEVREQVMEHDWQRQQHGCDPLDEHADLLQLKVAAILAVLNGSYTVSMEDWELAGMVRAASDATRAAAQAVIAARRAEQEAADRGRQARVAAAADAAITGQRVVTAARKIARKVWAEPGPVTYRSVQQSLSKRDRELLTETIAHAVEVDWITDERAPGQGADKRVLRPGKAVP
jgi:Bifunctional DNA primase/polymerase, N-terminal